MEGSEPSSGDNLLGMRMDFDVYLARSKVLSDVSVKSTGDAVNLLDVRAVARPGAGDVQITSDLIRIWIEDLRYPYAEAHEVTETVEAVVFRGVTRTGPDGIYVTATVTVTRP